MSIARRYCDDDAAPVRSLPRPDVVRRCRIWVADAAHVLRFDRRPNGHPWTGDKVVLARLMHRMKAELAEVEGVGL